MTSSIRIPVRYADPIIGMPGAIITPDLARQIVALAASPTQATPPAEAQPRQPTDEEARPCGICGELVTWAKSSSIGWHPIQYHDCKPVPGAKLDKALADLAACRAELAELQVKMHGLVPGHLLMDADKRIDALTAQRDRLAGLLMKIRNHPTVHMPWSIVDMIDAALAELENNK